MFESYSWSQFSSPLFQRLGKKILNLLIVVRVHGGGPSLMAVRSAARTVPFGGTHAGSSPALLTIYAGLTQR